MIFLAFTNLEISKGQSSSNFWGAFAYWKLEPSVVHVVHFCFFGSRAKAQEGMEDTTWGR